MTTISQAIRQSCDQVFRKPPDREPRRETRVVPARVRMLGLAFNLAARINRDWAARLLSDFWFRAFKPEPRHWVHGFWSAAERSVELHLHDKTLPVYLWGEGPLVVCVHGWGGSGTQFRRLIPRLVEAGCRVACFDAPAHGLNPGNRTHVLEFAQCLHAIEEQVARIDTVVAHSFGAMATLMAGYHGLSASRMVFLAPGLDVEEIFDGYCTSLKLEQKLVARFRAVVGGKMADIAGIDDAWTFFNPQRMLRHAADRNLVIYDRDDDEISYRGLRSVTDAWDKAETLETRGLGHNRILKDDRVIGRIVDWLQAAPERLT